MFDFLQRLLPSTYRETIQTPGPLVPDPSHPPRVLIRRGYDSAVVSWEPDRMHSGMPAWHVFGLRLEAARMLEAVEDWIEQQGRHADPRPELEGTVRYGRVLHVPLELTDTLAGLVCGYLTQAVSAALSLEEYTLLEASQSHVSC